MATQGERAVEERARYIDAAGGSIEAGVKKELATKLAWAVGSTLHTSYSKKGPLREWADRMASRLWEQRFEMINGKS